jgi:hypothetical protein
MIYMLLYVDNIVLITSSIALLQHIISALKWEFGMNDLEPLHHFLGASLYRSDQMDSSSCSANTLLTSLSASAWWIACHF